MTFKGNKWLPPKAQDRERQLKKIIKKEVV